MLSTNNFISLKLFNGVVMEFYLVWKECSIQQIISNERLAISCLQKNNSEIDELLILKNDEGYHYDRTNSARASGGISIFISGELFSSPAHITTELEAITVFN